MKCTCIVYWGCDSTKVLMLASKTNLFSSDDFDTGPDANVATITSLRVVASDQTAHNVSGHQAAVGKSNL